MHPFIYYLIFISIVAIVVTIYDKLIAGSDKRRVPEKTLLIIAALGGSVAMYITMQIIRHKTQHKKFMIGIPVIMVVQAILFALYLYWRSKQ
ncbi:MAG: DUF1294 domain-containing protein [Dehalococcoidales bacterium]|jgi:uncharacterized membrane protein YsdA (DUF1294 family)|nr:DUF1294 domain-containing protein [Dehalococcoidales bacterium]